MKHYARTYEVPMRVPDELLADLPRLDFVKCDVEGFEHEVFRHLQAYAAPLSAPYPNGAEWPGKPPGRGKSARGAGL